MGATRLIRETDIDFGDMLDGVGDARDEVLEQWADEIVTYIKRRWTNWVEETGTSQAAWKYTLDGDTLIITNDAGYTGYVHRAGTPVTNIEADIIFDDLVEHDAALIEAALELAIMEVLDGRP